MQQEDDGLKKMSKASLRAVMQIFGLKMAPSHTVPTSPLDKST